MTSTEKLDTHRKALTVNLDASTFGSFAEIGAGQDVVCWFLFVGGASGTVAKSISAYDKQISDSLYETGSRYVSRERLEAMLETEWTQLLGQLDKTRGKDKRFFSFVDTVSARSYAGTNDALASNFLVPIRVPAEFPDDANHSAPKREDEPAVGEVCSA